MKENSKELKEKEKYLFKKEYDEENGEINKIHFFIF